MSLPALFWTKLASFLSCSLLSVGVVYASKVFSHYSNAKEELEEEEDDEEDNTLICHKKRKNLDVSEATNGIVHFELHESNGTTETLQSYDNGTNAGAFSGDKLSIEVFANAIDTAIKGIAGGISNKGSFLWVPDEIYLHVFSYLTASELTSKVQVVCKDWSRLVDDHALWQALLDDLCSANGVPFHLCAGDSAGEYSLQSGEEDMIMRTWKQRYYVASGLQAQNEARIGWRKWLDVMLETTTHAVILGHNFEVYSISDKLQPSVVDLDDIFKGIGVKGNFPIPRVVHLGNKTFTVLNSLPHNWSLGFWLIARDLRMDTGLVIVKTRKLVLISIRERCDFCGQIAMVQGTLRAAELLMMVDY